MNFLGHLIVICAFVFTLVCADAQLEALIEFSKATGVQNWKTNTGWGQDDDPCGRNQTDKPWFGITCSGGWVTGLQLPKNGLGGTLPAAVANIPYLETLDLSGNLLIGTIPAQIDDLSSLQTLKLQYNHFRGSLPNLGTNNTGYTSIFLGNNQFQGTIPQSFMNIKSLSELDLSTNGLTGTVPAGLGDLDLMSLWIDTNNFSGTLPLSLCQSLILCSGSFNPHLMCASMSCTCGDMQSCNCNNMCANDGDCANGLCTTCVGAGPYQNGYCQS